MKSIGISGVPGTGKSSLAKKLSEELGLEVIELSDFAIRNNLIISYDRDRDSYVIDEERLVKAVEEYIRSRGPAIIVSHYIEIIPRDLLEAVFVLRRNPVELIKLLEARGWSKKKVAENVEAELLGVCTANAIEELGEDMVIEIDSTSKSVEELASEVFSILFGEKPTYYGASIDWLERLDDESLAYVINYIELYKE
jgi:adenylate kinase